MATPGDDIESDHALRAALASGLGVLRQDSLAARSLTAGPDAAANALAQTLLVLTQASAPSTVYRSVYPYYVGVKTFDEDGNVNGEHRFLGMFTTTACTRTCWTSRWSSAGSARSSTARASRWSPTPASGCSR